ncbi:DUF2617 family protein [Streptomyces sp. TRM70308]|uniref:DUF2617 family protein n=1 Tax=Streptomyces sp. TRM70308 TaxID=3131932 RepID=UPI003CFD9AF1
MSGIALAAPYLDTDADQLSFTLDLPVRPALAVREVSVDGLPVRLRLLGASHQVLAGPVRETVACLPGTDGGLPPELVRRFPQWNYRFSARVLHYPGQRFTDRVRRLHAETAADPRALCGVFPGCPDAVTALTVRRHGNGVGWHTWHTYPQSRRIVTTHTRLEAR